MEQKERNFFQKVWTSIKDFEAYEEFAAGKVTKAIKYILILTLIFTITITFAYTYKFYLGIENLKSYISENIDEISIKNGKLEVISDEKIIIEDEKNIVQMVIVDTDEDANVDEYKEKMKPYGTGILLLHDRIILENNLLANTEDIYYSNIVSIDIENKAEFLSLLNGTNMFYSNIVFFLMIFIYLFVIYLASNLVDCVVLGAIRIPFCKNYEVKAKI